MYTYVCATTTLGAGEVVHLMSGDTGWGLLVQGGDYIYIYIYIYTNCCRDCFTEMRGEVLHSYWL